MPIQVGAAIKIAKHAPVSPRNTVMAIRKRFETVYYLHTYLHSTPIISIITAWTKLTGMFGPEHINIDVDKVVCEDVTNSDWEFASELLVA